MNANLVDKLLPFSGEQLRAELIALAVRGDLRECGWPRWIGVAPEAPVPLGHIVSDPDDGVAIRVAERDEPFSCGFECCGVAVHEWLEVPASIATRLE